jgi:hypothetical protein
MVRMAVRMLALWLAGKVKSPRKAMGIAGAVAVVQCPFLRQKAAAGIQPCSVFGFRPAVGV